MKANSGQATIQLNRDVRPSREMGKLCGPRREEFR